MPPETDPLGPDAKLIIAIGPLAGTMAPKLLTRLLLEALGIDDIDAQGAIRFSMGRVTTKEQLDYVIDVLPETIARLRELSPIYAQQKQ